uniref:type II secretion system F family protein n=1 Tax=Eubacterium cellulosolvens TaxID=29322 RepID=UPI00048861F3|nr:type II secretion system F family protein [[Eubacterium] cellulosolvens]
MGIETGHFVLLVIATLLVVLWVFWAVKNEDTYKELTDSINPETYRYPDIFCVGFSIMQMLGIDSKSKKARARIKEIAEVQGKQYAEYHFYVINGAKWSYGFTVFVIFALFAAMANSVLALFFGALLAWLLMWYVDERFNDKLEERREQIIFDFPQMLSKMTLLVTSGMMVRDAWKKIASHSDRALYKEMQLTVIEMQNGVTEVDAYKNFADRCSIKEIRRFSATMVQSLQKGNGEIALFLRNMADEMWNEKKHLVKRKGEAANSKLLVPTAMIFIGILLMIMVPAFSGL